MTGVDQAGLSLEALQAIVRVLANQAFVRYWAHWNYPCESGWEMAIALRDRSRSLDSSELEAAGFRRVFSDGQAYYVIRRIDEQGRPFTSLKSMRNQRG